MAGFVVNAAVPGGHYEFHTDTHNVQQRIRDAAGKRVVTLQLDGDELEAALWGISHWNKRMQDTQEIPVQDQLQYQNVQCPNCFTDDVYEIHRTDYSNGNTSAVYGCHSCGQRWLHGEGVIQ